MLKKILIIFGIVIVIFIIRFLIWQSGLLIKIAPTSDMASDVSGYSSKVNTENVIQQFFTLNDGSFLITRYVHQYKMAEGFRAFPDGGIPYELLKMHDLIRVSNKGEILWQKLFIENEAPNYDYSAFLIKNSKKSREGFPSILSLPYASINTIRECSPSIIQLSRRKEQKIPGQSGYYEKDYVFLESFEPQNGINLNIENGDINSITDPKDLCIKDIREEITALKSCSPEFSDLNGISSRKFGLSIAGYDFRRYGQYLNECISPLLNEVSSPRNITFRGK